MSLLTEGAVRQAAARTIAVASKTSSSILREARNSTRNTFDIFLSHSRLDSEQILGVKVILESLGKTVYVDWVDDPLMDRSAVTARTAETLRNRMRQCRALFYLHSENATLSKWMPWELGYFDGFKSNVAILPIVQAEGRTSFTGVEYLGLYPYVDVTGRTSVVPGKLYLHRTANDFLGFENWAATSDKLRPVV